jgi:hypothetical protein
VLCSSHFLRVVSLLAQKCIERRIFMPYLNIRSVCTALFIFGSAGIANAQGGTSGAAGVGSSSMGGSAASAPGNSGAAPMQPSYSGRSSSDSRMGIPAPAGNDARTSSSGAAGQNSTFPNDSPSSR